MTNYENRGPGTHYHTTKGFFKHPVDVFIQRDGDSVTAYKTESGFFGAKTTEATYYTNPSDEVILSKLSR